MIITDKEKRNALMKENAKEHRRKYYESHIKTHKLECDVCKCMVNKYYFQEHIKTKRHQKYKEIGDAMKKN
jgi:hypothetical protein